MLLNQKMPKKGLNLTVSREANIEISTSNPDSSDIRELKATILSCAFHPTN